jgi:hypothetical protein
VEEEVAGAVEEEVAGALEDVLLLLDPPHAPRRTATIVEQMARKGVCFALNQASVRGGRGSLRDQGGSAADARVLGSADSTAALIAAISRSLTR